MTSNLLNHKKLRTGGPWWFIQLWAQLYFQHHIPNFQGLTKNSFPDESGKPIRCTSYSQALFSLPGSKLNSTDAANWFRVFYKGLDNPLYFHSLNLKPLRTQLPSGRTALSMTTALGIYIP